MCPSLFSRPHVFLYRFEVVSTSALLTLVKFADDMALVARLREYRILSSFRLLNLTHVLVEEATEFWSQQLCPLYCCLVESILSFSFDIVT